MIGHSTCSRSRPTCIRRLQRRAGRRRTQDASRAVRAEAANGPTEQCDRSVWVAAPLTVQLAKRRVASRLIIVAH